MRPGRCELSGFNDKKTFLFGNCNSWSLACFLRKSCYRFFNESSKVRCDHQSLQVTSDLRPSKVSSLQSNIMNRGSGVCRPWILAGNVSVSRLFNSWLRIAWVDGKFQGPPATVILLPTPTPIRIPWGHGNGMGPADGARGVPWFCWEHKSPRPSKSTPMGSTKIQLQP